MIFLINGNVIFFHREITLTYLYYVMMLTHLYYVITSLGTTSCAPFLVLIRVVDKCEHQYLCTNIYITFCNLLVIFKNNHHLLFELIVQRECVTVRYWFLLHCMSCRPGQCVSLDVTPSRTACITGCHTIQDSVYHWMSHHPGQCVSLDVTPSRTVWLSVATTHVINTIISLRSTVNPKKYTHAVAKDLLNKN